MFLISVKFRDPCSKRSREIPPKTVAGSIFEFFFHYNFRPEADSDVLSGVVVDYAGVDVHVKLGDFRSNGS